MPTAEPLVELRGITKTYPGGVVANDNISLTIYRGEVLALLGENGAGKTTLVSILAGHLEPDSGEIRVNGRPARFRSPRDAVRAGIVLVPQHPMLIEQFTVLENIALAARLAGVHRSPRSVRKALRGVAEEYGLEVDPDARVWRLSMGERQKAEIAKALVLGARLLLLDEPTTHLAPRESERLLETSRRLAEAGRSVVLITHKLREALEAADRIAVMRKGRLVAVLSRAEASPDKLLNLMFGDRRVAAESFPPRQPGSTVLRVDNLRVADEHGVETVKGVSLEVRAGEVVGVAGVAGNGQRELFEALIGLRRPVAGRIILQGRDVTGSGPPERGRLGVAVIPEERLGWALVPGKSLVFNTALGMYSSERGPYRGALVSWEEARATTERIIKSMNVKAPGPDAPPEALSGGNMQRYIVGRELEKRPSLILAMNPTSGLDVAAARFVHELLDRSARRGGAGVLVFSEDLDELMILADRILVMSRGRIVYSAGRPFDVMRIAEAMTS